MSRNYARFYILLNRLPTEDKDELKASLVSQYTGGRTESLREMTVNEYDAMCEDMQRMDENYKAREIYREQLRQKRSTVLKLMQKQGIDTTDWNRVDAYWQKSPDRGQEVRPADDRGTGYGGHQTPDHPKEREGKEHGLFTTKLIKAMTEERKAVEMTDEELKQFEAFKAEQAAKRAKEQAKRDREAYKELVDETIEEAIPDLQAVSDCIKTVKNGVLNNFRRVIDMKSEVLKLKKDGQRTDTFTNSAGDKRITVGYYETDGYRDTVEDGIAIVKEYIEGLADNKKTKALVKMVLRLLARNAQGTLKASRIVQLRKIAEESEDERFMEGVQIIEEAYQPAISKQFIRAEIKNDNGAWIAIPLGMTEA